MKTGVLPLTVAPPPAPCSRQAVSCCVSAAHFATEGRGTVARFSSELVQGSSASKRDVCATRPANTAGAPAAPAPNRGMVRNTLAPGSEAAAAAGGRTKSSKLRVNQRHVTRKPFESRIVGSLACKAEGGWFAQLVNA
eukprot:6705232-Pyramimonas_sp.AAC.1